jgi:hypothetical protein
MIRKRKVMARYSVRRINTTTIHVLDAKHGLAVAAKVYFKKECNGSGWKLAPMTSTRTGSRKLHATPEAAISSMRYLTLMEARQAIAVIDSL